MTISTFSMQLGVTVAAISMLQPGPPRYARRFLPLVLDLSYCSVTQRSECLTFIFSEPYSLLRLLGKITSLNTSNITQSSPFSLPPKSCLFESVRDLNRHLNFLFRREPREQATYLLPRGRITHTIHIPLPRIHKQHLQPSRVPSTDSRCCCLL